MAGVVAGSPLGVELGLGAGVSPGAAVGIVEGVPPGVWGEPSPGVIVGGGTSAGLATVVKVGLS